MYHQGSIYPIARWPTGSKTASQAGGILPSCYTLSHYSSSVQWSYTTSGFSTQRANNVIIPYLAFLWCARQDGSFILGDGRHVDHDGATLCGGRAGGPFIWGSGWWRGDWTWINSVWTIITWAIISEIIVSLLALCEGNPPVTGGFPSQRASNMKLRWFLCHKLQQAVEQTVELQICDAMALMWCHCNNAHIRHPCFKFHWILFLRVRVLTQRKVKGVVLDVGEWFGDPLASRDGWQTQWNRRHFCLVPRFVSFLSRLLHGSLVNLACWTNKVKWKMTSFRSL